MNQNMQNDIPEIPSAPQNLEQSPPDMNQSKKFDFLNQGLDGESAAKPNAVNNKASNGNLSDAFDDFNLENELNTVPAQ